MNADVSTALCRWLNWTQFSEEKVQQILRERHVAQCRHDRWDEMNMSCSDCGVTRQELAMLRGGSRYEFAVKRFTY